MLVVDDWATLREGLARLIRARFPAHIEVHTADSAAAARRQLALTPPRVAILDVDLAGTDGLALLPQLPDHCRVLVLTSHGDPATRARARRLGAWGFFEKSEPAAALMDCLSTLLAPEMQGEHSPGDSGASSASKKDRAL